MEARNRIGGRCYTNREFADIPVEFGAELIHGENVSTWDWVRQLSLKTIHWKKQEDSLVRMEDGRLLTMKEARATNPDFDMTRTWDLPQIPVEGQDESWKDYLERIGFSKEQLQYVKRSFANAAGEDMRFLSARAMLTDINYTEAGNNDYRILDGYDSIYKALGKGLKIRLNTVVKEIEWGDFGVRVHTEKETFQGEKAIITLPLGVLQSNSVNFQPNLPSDYQEAIKHLKMGWGIKMVYFFKKNITPPDISAIYSNTNPPMWWSPSFGRKHQGQVWTAFITGDWARELLDLEELQALEMGLRTLRKELNINSLYPEKMHLMNWVADPFSMGGYSIIPTGHLDKNPILAKPLSPLYFAGEHTAEVYEISTIHGAYNSGKRAAEHILKND